jgi:dTDP-4-dehydrorhamnose reductase
MKYLLTGRNGQLARAFIRRFEEREIDYMAPEKSQLNITDSSNVRDTVSSFKPEVLINCAAYNLVDDAEREHEKAFAVNSTGPQILARVARDYKAVFVHFGSDYIFDGSKFSGLYEEEDSVNPLNEYGKSKLEGEYLIRKESDDYLIFRLSWVFGEGKQNFIHKLSDWASRSEFLKIACDEFSVPTYTYTVADAVLLALDRGVRGLFHLTSNGYCSRYEWAKFIFKHLKITKFIRPVSIDTFDLPARRPKFSAMSNEKLSKCLGMEIPDWEETVTSYLRKSSF